MKIKRKLRVTVEKGMALSDYPYDTGIVEILSNKHTYSYDPSGTALNTYIRIGNVVAIRSSDHSYNEMYGDLTLVHKRILRFKS